MKTTRVCAMDLCDKPLDNKGARGYCHTHYQRLRWQGKFEIPPVLSAAERLVAGLDEAANGCLEWTKGGSVEGYGRIRVDGDNVSTHRLAWELVNGPIPDGLWVLHRCDNPPCCNPAHLFLGTSLENNRDCAAKGRTFGQQKTHCSHGHFYDEANTYTDQTGKRHCRECRRLTGAGRYQARVLDQRPVKATKTHCPSGHEYAGENLYVAPDGSRVCRQCKAANDARYRQRKKAAPC